MSLRSLADRWKFWWKAQNRHGVHSPFIYRFLDEALYRKDLKHLPAQRRLLQAATGYLKVEKAGAAVPEAGLALWLREQCPQISWQEPPVDLYIFEAPEPGLPAMLEDAGQWDPHMAIFVGNLRRDPRGYAIWETATRHPAVRVILETYPAGLLFFRTGQARQHFRIRI